MADLNIRIAIEEDGEEIVHRETSSFEVAEQNLESLKNWYEKRQAEIETTLEEEREAEKMGEGEDY